MGWRLLRALDHCIAADGSRLSTPNCRRSAETPLCLRYEVRTGCSWRMLPNDLPPWQNVCDHFRRWTAKNLFETIHDLLRAMWRRREGRDAAPTGRSIGFGSCAHRREPNGPSMLLTATSRHADSVTPRCRKQNLDPVSRAPSPRREEFSATVPSSCTIAVRPPNDPPSCQGGTS